MVGNAVLVHHSDVVGRPDLVAQLWLEQDDYSDKYTISTNTEYITIKVSTINTAKGYAKVGIKNIDGGGNDITLETPTLSPASI